MWRRSKRPGLHPERFQGHEVDAAVLSPFDSRGEGRVRCHDQSWAARVLGGEVSSVWACGRVVVMGREGTHL